MVCLMVGTVVDKGVASLGITVRDGEPEAANGTNNNVTLEGYDPNDPYLISTKLGFAMAVTFAVGCLQVSAHSLWRYMYTHLLRWA